MSRIAFCADGTWCGPSNDTNITKLFDAIPQIDGQQTAFYELGVGAGEPGIDKLLDGAFGDDLLEKVKSAYNTIAGVYEEGDQIFLFGFSRGAYTARSVAGMIAIVGLPGTAHDDAFVETAFQAYRATDPAERQRLIDSLAAYQLIDAKITMVGVFDTVGALGIPAIFGGVDKREYSFLDTQLHPDVRNAFHAVAIDEKRVQFPATLWTSAPAPGQTVRQVYFCGCHSDVGGGNPADADGTALSEIPLSWIMAAAAGLGLVFTPEAAAQYPSPFGGQAALDTIHESWSLIPWLLPKSREIAADAAMANSVDIRLARIADYRPGNVRLTGGTLEAGYTSEVVVTLPA